MTSFMKLTGVKNAGKYPLIGIGGGGGEFTVKLSTVQNDSFIT
jgi:hypothetical protein